MRLARIEHKAGKIPLAGDRRSGEQAERAGRERHGIGGDAGCGDRLAARSSSGSILARAQPSSISSTDLSARTRSPRLALLTSQCDAAVRKAVDQAVRIARIVFEPADRNNVPRRHTQHRSECRAILHGGPLGSRGRPLRLGLSGDDRQPVRRVREALARHWQITDGTGRIEDVRGAGVVGEQPELNPGDSYQYTSGCPLSTPSGIMVGSYTMRNARGEMFEVDIPAFSLDIPGKSRTVN